MFVVGINCAAMAPAIFAFSVSVGNLYRRFDCSRSRGAQTTVPIESEPVGAGGQRLRDLSRAQWKSGVAAWLGWLFDGLDMHLYTLVAAPFVASLLAVSDPSDPQVKKCSALIQGGFLLGWALGGGIFGRLGDCVGRCRALSLTILTYAVFTGLSSVAMTWWHLLFFRFLAALGIGGEWAIGASLLSETWPHRYRHWIAAVLQSAVNIGILLASVATYLLAGKNPRFVFLVGVLPAFLVFWIRRQVPESDEWTAASACAMDAPAAPAIGDLFRPGLRRVSVLVILICACSLTAHWAFVFWSQQHLYNLPDLAGRPEDEKRRLVSIAMSLVMIASIAGNFVAGWLANRIGDRRAIAAMCLGYFVMMAGTYATAVDHVALVILLPIVSVFSGFFALFTMYLPPLFPTLLRTTGAGFCYNIGRIASAVGTVVFGLISVVTDYRIALLLAACLFLPAGLLALRLPELNGQRDDSSID
jgi:MFS family permease